MMQLDYSNRSYVCGWTQILKLWKVDPNYVYTEKVLQSQVVQNESFRLLADGDCSNVSLFKFVDYQCYNGSDFLC